MMNEYQEEIANTAKNMFDSGTLKLEVQDPNKIYFQKSLKNLILGNRLTGPALSSDESFSQLLS